MPSDGVGLLLVSLHKEIHTLKNGTQRPFVEVRLDGKHVGELSNVTSAHLLPLLGHTETVGETALAYAKVTGSALAAQLVLHAAKATEISNDWLSNGPHPAPKLLPLAKRYDVPPAYAPYMGRIRPDSVCFRGWPVFPRAGIQFESHLGHSVSAGQRHV